MKKGSIIILGFLSTLAVTAQPQKKTFQNSSQQPNIRVSQSQTVKDIDDNVYHTVTIGTQVWMVENLKTTKLIDGTPIPLVTEAEAWHDLGKPGYCWYDNDVTKNRNTYGGLYNWYAVNTGKLAPTGWHVPTDEEWKILENYLMANGYNYDETTTSNKYAKAMASTTGWAESNFEGAIGNTDYPTYRNKSGFSAVPGGYRVESDDSFDAIGYSSYWWSSSSIEDDIYGALYWFVYYDNSHVSSYRLGKWCGVSVRCIRD